MKKFQKFLVVDWLIDETAPVEFGEIAAERISERFWAAVHVVNFLHIIFASFGFMTFIMNLGLI